MARQILTESVLAIQKEWLLFVLLILCVAAAFAAEHALRWPLARRHRQSLHLAVLAAVLALGLGLGWQQRFLCDDAFISFRYAENLAQGRGLVWNDGERVEGYTNFLWTALLGGLGRLGADIPLSALFGGLATFVLAFPLGDIRTRMTDLEPAQALHFGELLQEAEALLPPGDPDLVRLSRRLAARFILDHLPEGATLSGSAFGPGPVAAAVASQQPVAGFQGSGFLDSYHGGDAATGRVELPEIELPEAPVSVLVGGSENCDKAHVGLQVDGQIVRRVCGRDDELLRPEQLRTGLHAGQRGRIVIVDEATESWGHILADDIVIVRSPASARLQ